MRQPELVFHADWSGAPRGRVTACARLSDGGYVASAPATPLRTPASRAASCVVLFWTIGGQPAGRTCRDLGLARRDRLRAGVRFSLWPFDGELDELLERGSVVVAETYPTEFHEQLGIDLGRGSKRNVSVRRSASGALKRAAARAHVELAPDLGRAIAAGFENDDELDAVIGLLGMLDVLRREPLATAPLEPAIRRTEGWMLGRAAR
jgi:hypothetical protein